MRLRREPFGCEYAGYSRWTGGERLYIKIFGALDLSTRYRFMAIREALPSTASSILDAGCGNGLYAFYMKRLYPGATIVAWDTDPKRIGWAQDYARKTGVTGMTFEVRDMNDVTAGRDAERFDLILSVESLQYVDDHVAILKGLSRALKPSGSLILHVPLRSVPEANEKQAFSQKGLLDLFPSIGLSLKRGHFTLGWFHRALVSIYRRLVGTKSGMMAAIAFPLFLSLGIMRPNRYPAGLHGLFCLEKMTAD